MTYELQSILTVIFSIGAIIVSLFIAKRQKHKMPWAGIILVLGIFALFGLMSVFRVDWFGPDIDGRFIPIDLLVLPATIWMVAMSSLARVSKQNKLEAQNARTAALNDIAKSFVTSNSLSDAAKTALQIISQTMKTDGAVAFSIDSDNKRISILAIHGKRPRNYIDFLEKLDKSLGTTLKAINNYHNGKKDDLLSIQGQSEKIFHDEGFETIAGAPLTIGRGKARGMILVYSKEKNLLTKEDSEFLNLMAFELGLWITRMQNLAELKRFTETQKGLLDISLMLQEELDADKISHSIISKLVQLIPCRDAMVYLCNDKRKIMWAADAIGKDAAAVMAEGEFPMSEAGLAGVVLQSGKAEIINDTLADGRGKQIMGTDRETTAMLALPLIIKGGPLGIIQLHRDHPDTFTEEELEIGVLFAQQASAALENALLLKMTEQEMDRSKLYLDLLSHDIANLNTPLYSYYDMLMKSDCGAETKEVIKKSYAQIEAMNALVSRVRKLSKGDLEDMEEPQVIAVRHVMDEAIRGLRRAFPNKEIEVELEIPEEVSHVKAGEMLDEIFLNLLHNSVKFSSGKNVKISITIEKMEIRGKWFCATRISDHGSGVPDSMKEKIFQGAMGSSASFARGFGIGLNMCKKLVEKYGGSIWVEDRVEGDHSKGACFVVLLPITTS